MSSLIGRVVNVVKGGINCKLNIKIIKWFMIWLALLSYGAGYECTRGKLEENKKINCKNKKGQCVRVTWGFWEFLF